MSSYPCQVSDSWTPPVTYARLKKKSRDENVVGNYLSSQLLCGGAHQMEWGKAFGSDSTEAIFTNVIEQITFVG